MKEEVKKKIYHIGHCVTKKIGKNPSVMSVEETIDFIIKNKCSVSRFGDGELRWMYGLKQNSFQKQDRKMQSALLESIKTKENNLLVCIPDVFEDLDQYTTEAKQFWENNLCKFRFFWLKILDIKYKYGNSDFTRFYLDFMDKDFANGRISKIKKIWENRDCVLVEGELTRFGVGNDLLASAKSIRRVICPSKNAFDVYEKIYDFVCNYINKETLILIALGPTASVLSVDLNKKGFQAIDIGHLDVEYEWSLLGVTEKIPLTGKYVNEAGGFQHEYSDYILEEYKNQIMFTVER